jgi:hypothetical protein
MLGHGQVIIGTPDGNFPADIASMQARLGIIAAYTAQLGKNAIPAF